MFQFNKSLIFDPDMARTNKFSDALPLIRLLMGALLSGVAGSWLSPPPVGSSLFSFAELLVP